MSNDNKRKLYEALSQDYDMGDFEQFCTDINDDAKRRKLYDATSEEYDFGDYDSFSRQLGFGGNVDMSSSNAMQSNFSTANDAPISLTANSVEEHQNERRPIHGVDYSTAEDAPEPEWEGVSDEQLAELRKQSEETMRSMRASTVESQDRILNMGRHQSASINNETVTGGLEYNPATGKVEQTYITPTGDKTFDKTVADMVSREHRKMIGDLEESQKQPTIDEMVQSAEHEVQELTAARDKAQNDKGVVFGGVPGGVNVRSYSRSPKSGINTDADKRLDLAHSKLIMANQMKRLKEHGEKFGKGPGFKDALKSWQGFKDGTVGNLGKFANGIIDWFTDPDIMGVLSMSGFAPVREVAEKMDAQRKAYTDAHGGNDNGFEPSLSTDEKELMDYFMRLTDIESKEETSMAFTVGRAIPEIVALGVQLAYNPAAGAGRMAQTATKEAVKGFSKAAYRKGAEYAARALGDIAEGVVAAGTTQLGSTLGRAEKIAAGGSDSAFGTALMSQASGNFGLMAGKYFAPVGQAIWKGVGTAAEKAGMGTVKGFVDEVLSQTTKNGAADFAKSLHLTGTIENTLGAKLGEALNGVTAGEITFDTDSEHGLFNAHRFAETLTEFAVLDGVMKGYHAIGYRTPLYRAKIDMEAASHRASLAFGDPRVWQSILTSLKGGKRSFGEVADQMRGSTTDNPLPGRWSILEDAIMSGFDESVVGREGIKLHDGKGKDAPQSLKAVYDILSNPRYTNEQRGAALDFVRAAMRYDGMRRGVELNRKAQEVAAEDVEFSEVEAQRLEMHKGWQTEYEHGRLLMEKADETNPEAVAEVKTEVDAVASRMQDAYRGIEDAFGSEAEIIQAQISVDPWIVLDNQEMGYDQREAVVEFINAKAALDGVNDASEESLERKRIAVESEVAMRTHKDNRMIQPVVLAGGNDQQFYIVKGDVALSPDGSINTAKSSDFIVVYNPKTGEYEFTSVSQIDRVDSPIDPQTEIDGSMRAYDEQRVKLPLPENTEGATSTDVADGEDRVSPEVDASKQQETALSRIPVNEQGKPDFAAAETPEIGWDGLVEKYQGKESRAQSFADNMVAIRKNELAKAQKIKSKPTEDPDEWDAAERSREEAIEKAQAALEAWTSIAGVAGRRKAEQEAQIAADRAAREAMEQEAIQRKADEEARWQESKQKLDRRLRETAEKYRDIPEVMQILEMDSPISIDEVASVILSTNKVLLNDVESGNHKIKMGAKHHVGIGMGEARKLFGLFASEAKGGKSIERLAEDVFEEACQDYGVPYDNGEALNALIEMIHGANTMSDIRNYITNKRIRQAEKIGEAYREHEMEAYDKYCRDAYGMSGADYSAYEERLYDEIAKTHEDFDEQEFYSNIADDILNEQRKRAENESRSDIERVEDVEPAGAVEAHGSGGEVLPGASADHAAGVAADGRGSEISGRDGHKEHDQRSGVSGEASRGTDVTEQLAGDAGRLGGETSIDSQTDAGQELDENGYPFVTAPDGTTSFGVIRPNSGLSEAPIKLSRGYQDNDGKGYGLLHIEANHGAQIRSLGFKSVEDFVSFVSKNYDEDNIRIGRHRRRGEATYLLQVSNEHDNTLFIELSHDGSYWNVNSGGIFRKGYSNKKETVAKTEPQQPNNANSDGSSLSDRENHGIIPSEPNGKPTVSDSKDKSLSSNKQAGDTESSEANKSDISERSDKDESSSGVTDIKKTPIEDFGEKILGARKDMLREFGKTIENVTEQSLIELPLSKAFKRPNLKKMVDNGAISEDDAILAEAVMQALVYGERKPALTRRMSSKREIASWAKRTHSGIRLLGGILSGDAEQRARAMEEYRVERSKALDDAKAHLEKIRGWNSDKVFRDIKEFPDPVEVMVRVLDELGYRPGDKVELPLCQIGMDSTDQSYTAKSQGKQGSLWFDNYYNTLDDAVSAMVKAAKLAAGDREVELPQRCFNVRGAGDPIKKETGEFKVLWIGRGANVLDKTFKSETEAKEFAAQKEGKVIPKFTYTGEYETYEVTVMNPLTGNRHVVKKGFSTRAEATAYLDDSPAEANALSLDAIYAEMGKKGKSREHFYVGSSWDRIAQKRIYSVYSDDKNNPWPIVKDFNSRDEAVKWLDENKERLESERRDEIKRHNSIVYFDNTESRRVGIDYRNGKDADAKMYEETFGFRGVQFGNWTNDADRQAALNQAYDGFMDMANALGLSPRAMSFDGELGLAFGARGSGHAMAHYEPVEVVINLTKTMGAGSLAHEWWHALDNYLSRKGGVPMGYASHGNGLEGVSPEVGTSMQELTDRINGTPYMQRSAAKGDYWGRGTEVTARLFAEWINYKLADRNTTNPFLSRGVMPKTVEIVQRWNYMVYKADEMRKAERENRTPSITSFEDFKKDPRSLTGHPYPTIDEVKEFSPALDRLFEALSGREHESGSMARDAGASYRRRRKRVSSMAGRSLFDDMSSDGLGKIDRQMRGNAEMANTAIDAFSRDYMDYLDESQKLEAEIESMKKGTKEHADTVEHLEFIEQQIIDGQRRLEESLSNYYHDNGQSPEDARRSAHDMLARVRGEVEVRRKQNSLKSLLPDSRQTVEVLMQNEVSNEPEKKQMHTAGGDTISYEAVGHLPETADGEFAWVERQFSTTGEFAFTGNERIRSRDDVAYLFRSLENYSIEHAFAVLVKDGKPVVVHLGMGTANASLVDNKAVRAAYDAFGADKIYFVHNHPSGVLTDSVPDRRVLATMSSMFKDSVEVEAIIIDTTSGQYSVFGAEPSMKADRPVSGDNVGVSVHRFDRQAFSEKPELEVSHIKSSEDIARFVSAQRLGRKGKVSYLILSNQLEIVGHFHTTHSDLSDTKGLGDEIASTATKYGGMSVAIYGNMSLDGIKALSERISQSSGGIKTIDAVSVNNGLRTSAYDEGLIGESEPEYGLKNQDEDVVYRQGERNITPDEAKTESMEARAIELAAKYNTKINVVRSSDEVALLPSARRRNAKGWFDPMARDGENAVTVVLPNHANVADVENTVVHEIIAHKGLRDLVGRDHFDTFLDEIHGHVAGHIREKIDTATQKMVDAETQRLANEKGGGVFAEAEARIEAEAKRTQFIRDATEEYMADMAERIGDSGFEKMDAEELTLWGRIKAKIQKLLEKAMQGVKWGKHVKLSDKDLAYILYRSWKKARGKKDMIADASDDAVMRMRTGYNEPMLREITSEKKAALRAEATADRIEELFDKAVRGNLTGKPIEVGRLTSAGKAYLERLSGMKLKDEVSFVLNPSDLAHIHRRHFGKNEKDSRNVPLTSLDIRQMAEIISTPGRVVFGKEKGGNERNMFFFLKDAGDGSYNLMEIYSDKRGNLTAKSFFKSKEGVSQRAMLLNESSTLTSVTDGATLSDNAKLPKFFEYPKSETDNELRFRDGDLGFEEAITKMKTDTMQANAGNLQAKQAAMRAIGGNLSKLRQAMARQKEYDLSTVKSVTDLARVLMDSGLLDDLSKYETKRILGAVDGVLGKTDVSKYVQKVFDIMVDNQLRKGSNDFGLLLGKGRSNVNARGIEVQGKLDADGQRMTQVVKKNMSLSADEIDARIADAMDRMASDDVAMADNASIEYAGLQLARRYAEDIARSRNDEKSLRDSINQAKEEKNAGQMSDTAYRQYVEAAEDAIRQNKIERAEAYNELIEQLGGILSESIVRAKTWRDGEKYRIAEIHHNANSDMEGRPTDEHHKDSTIQKTLNNSIARFMLAPLGTFDQMLRMFGNKSVSGEGYLWNRFMRQWTDSTEQEYVGYRDALKELDAKVSEVFSKKMKWGDLISMERGMKKATVTFWDGGKMKEHQLTQGNLLYIYMANKMSDGRMKLRRMGIEQEDVDEITKMLDPRFVELADWMQEEFLVEKRNKYNEVHKRMFGASMSSIDNYFPLKILANARLENVDVADDTTDTALPATSTGSIIKRTRNNLALDVTGADAFSVVLDHIQEMERWAAFAEFNRDLNTLLSYKHFRNQVMNMSSVYGSGKTLWNNFRNVCSMAAGAYRPPIASLDKAAVNIAKGVTAAKVSFRMFTALKQFLSMPAYLPDSNPAYLAMNIANPIGAWQWAMKELPLFEKRWQSRMSGDPRLMKSEMDWKMWRNRVVEIASRIGMSPNAFVDALTVSIGAHAMYQTRRDKYIRQGYNKSIAEKRAKQDATILFNQTQQSSESAFLSTMQVDRSWLSVLFTVFRNSSMSYTRQLYDAIRNISRKGVPGYRTLTEEFMAKQMMRDGIAPEKADQNARRAYRTSIIRDLARIGIFGFVMQYAWNIGAYMPYLLLGDDDEVKDTMMDDVMNHTLYGSVEGLTGGDVMSLAGQMWLNGEGNMSYLVKDMPLASDLSSIFKKWPKDEVAAMNDVINLFVQSSIGVNPQSLTDAVVAVIDYCGDDANTSRECALLICRILNCPPSQLDKIYFDELGVDGLEASKMSPAEIAERYAAYKTMRNAPLTGHLYSDEQRDSVMNVHRKKAQKIAKDNMGKMLSSSDVLKTVLAEYDRMSDLNKELAEIRKEHPEQYRDRYEAVRDSIDARLYRRVGRYKHDIKELTEAWLKAGTVAERDSLATLMRETRDVMLEDVAR